MNFFLLFFQKLCKWYQEVELIRFSTRVHNCLKIYIGSKKNDIAALVKKTYFDDKLKNYKEVT